MIIVLLSVLTSWVWNNYHYGQNFSGVTPEKVQVNSPIIRDPPMKLSWRGWQAIRKADPLDQKTLLARFTMVIQQGQIVDVHVLESSGVPEVDQECREFLRKNWKFAAGTNQSLTAPITFHQNYYP